MTCTTLPVSYFNILCMCELPSVCLWAEPGLLSLWPLGPSQLTGHFQPAPAADWRSRSPTGRVREKQISIKNPNLPKAHFGQTWIICITKHEWLCFYLWFHMCEYNRWFLRLKDWSCISQSVSLFTIKSLFFFCFFKYSCHLDMTDAGDLLLVLFIKLSNLCNSVVWSSLIDIATTTPYTVWWHRVQRGEQS